MNIDYFDLFLFNYNILLVFKVIKSRLVIENSFDMILKELIEM